MVEGNQQDPTEAFINRWQASDASERSNAPLFLTELCDLLHLDHPLQLFDSKTEELAIYFRVDG